MLTTEQQIERYMAAHPERSEEFAHKVAHYAAIRGQRWEDEKSDWVYPTHR